MGDVKIDHKGSGTWVGAMVRVRCSLSGMASIQLLLYFAFGSDVRATERSNYSVAVRHG